MVSAPRKHGELILPMNAKLNALIDEEIGEDKGQMLPQGRGVDWAITRLDPESGESKAAPQATLYTAKQGG